MAEDAHNMRRISRDEVYKLLIERGTTAIIRTLPIIGRAFSTSVNFYRKELDSDEFKGLFLLPWDDWSLFQYFSHSGLLNPSNRLCSIRLTDAVSQYPNSDKNDEHTKKIETLKESILQNGYVDDFKSYAIFETAKPDDLYLVDGYHRVLAYQNLIGAGKVNYAKISFILGEVKSIEDTLGHFNRIRGNERR